LRKTLTSSILARGAKIVVRLPLTGSWSPRSPEPPGTTPDGAAFTEDEQAAAVTELRELAGGRADLLAQVCGIFEGASAGRHDEPLARQAATLCRLAGADDALIPQWAAEGRRRALTARQPPHGGRPVYQDAADQHRRHGSQA
jgi:hypothetical protein